MAKAQNVYKKSRTRKTIKRGTVVQENFQFRKWEGEEMCTTGF
jgi:hypothetical protein